MEKWQTHGGITGFAGRVLDRPANSAMNRWLLVAEA
jgi:hypothetical protein